MPVLPLCPLESSTACPFPATGTRVWSIHSGHLQKPEHRRAYTSGGTGNILCCASQTHKNRQRNCNSHLSSDLSLPVLPSRLWPPAPHCQSVLHAAQGLTSVEQTSAQQVWQMGALVSQGAGQAHHQEGVPGDFTLVITTQGAVPPVLEWRWEGQLCIRGVGRTCLYPQEVTEATARPFKEKPSAT